MSKDFSNQDDFNTNFDRSYRNNEMDFERINYRLRILGSNIQDISRQIQELKELYLTKQQN